MSFRSTFASPGGFTTQRLDLILQKRKDETPKPAEKPLPGETSPTSKPSIESDSDGSKQESALDRWRKKMAQQGRETELSPTTSPSRVSSSSSSRDPYMPAAFDRFDRVTRSNSSIEPRRKLDYVSSSWEKDRDKDVDTGGGVLQGVSSSTMGLPRRRRERAARQNRAHRSTTATTGVNGTSVSSSNLQKKAFDSELLADPRGSQTSLNSTSERSLTSRRFQQLFSGANSDNTSSSSSEDEEVDQGSNGDYPDSLEENSDGGDPGGGGYKGKKPSSSGLTRSLSSASTILRGSGWTPASRLIRDRYSEVGQEKQPRPGTRANWAAWRGDIYGANTGSKDSDPTSKGSESGALDRRDRSDRTGDKNQGVGSKGNNVGVKAKNTSEIEEDADLDTRGKRKNYNRPSLPDSGRQCDDSKDPPVTGGNRGQGDVTPKGQGSGLDLLDLEPQGEDLGGPAAPLPPALTLSYFPGYTKPKGVVDGGGGARSGHWAGHVPMTTGHTPAEWYLYRGSAAMGDDHPDSGQPKPETSQKGHPEDIKRDSKNSRSNQKVNLKGKETDLPTAKSSGENDRDINDNKSDRLKRVYIDGSERWSSPDRNSSRRQVGETYQSSEARGPSPPPPHASPDRQQANSGRADGGVGTVNRDYTGRDNPPTNSPPQDPLSANAPNDDDGHYKGGQHSATRVLPMTSPKQEGGGGDQGDSNDVFLPPPTPQSDQRATSESPPRDNTTRTRRSSGDLKEGKRSPPTSRIPGGEGREAASPHRLAAVAKASPGLGTEDLARSPRVSFSDDLKVVQVSPAAKRKARTEPSPGERAERGEMADTPRTVEERVDPTGEAQTPTKTSPPPVGKTPVKGILQNGRKEGEVVHRPAPDDSEGMRKDEDVEETQEEHSSPSRASKVEMRAGRRNDLTPSSQSVSKRHSFSSSRDVPHSYRTFMARPTPRLEDQDKGQNPGVGTPSTERRLRGAEGTKPGGRSGSLRSSGPQRSSLTSRHRGTEGRDDRRNSLDYSSNVKASPAVNRQRKVGMGLRGSTDSLNRGQRDSKRGSTESLNMGHRDSKRGSTESLHRKPRDSKRGSTDSLNVSHHYARSVSKEPSIPKHVDKERKPSKDKTPKPAPDVDNSGFTLSFKDFMEQRKKQGTIVLPKSQHEKSPSKRSNSKEPLNNKSGTTSELLKSKSDSPPSSVTLSSLKQIREREGHTGPRPTQHDQGANNDNHTDSRSSDNVEREGDSGSFKKGKDRWSFRSKSHKKSQEAEGSEESGTSSSRKKDQGVGAVLSNFFKRGKKSKKPPENESTFYLSPEGGAADDDGSHSPKRPEESKTGSTGHTDVENDDDVTGGQSEGSDSNPGFTLGPHGHSDTERDPLSALFAKPESGESSNDNEGSPPIDKESPSPGGLRPGSRGTVDKSPLTLFLDGVGSRSDSPALSGISSIDDGTGFSGSRNKDYHKPDYKHFLDMDSLVANLTNTSMEQDEGGSSTSGVSAGTSDDPASSIMGSLEDLAMALLEAELREEGLLEGEPGRPDPDYQGRIQSIKADLQKFSAHVGRALKKHKQIDSSERAPSVSDLSVTSSRSSRSAWLRDPTIDAKPISDPALRNKLKTARSPGTRVTSRDQKILELMLAKREEEKAAEGRRQAARRAWETEKQHEDAVRTTTEVRRRESLARQRQREKDLHKSRRHSESNDSLHSAYSERRDDDEDRRDCEDVLRYKEGQWASQSQKVNDLRPGQGSMRRRDPMAKYRSMDDMRCERPWVTHNTQALMAKEKKMAERRLQNLQRKKSQEERIAAQKREQEDMAKLVSERQERELRRANSMKEAKEQEQLMQRKLKNYYQKKRHEDRVGDIKRKSREDLNTLQAAIEMKQATAQSILQQQESRKYNELRRSTKRSGSMTDLDTRISRSKENQQRLQEELSSWHNDLLSYSKMMEKRAEEQAKVTVQQKAKRASEDRRNKEKLQKKNFKKLLAQEEEWKADVEATIAMKDAKTRMLQMERDETVQESRSMAAASQRMREELRSAYSSDTIDELSRRAELQNKLGLESTGVNPGLAGTTKNMSTLTLG